MGQTSMFDLTIQNAINLELNRAETARSSANEGMARVCARRAAGIAIRALFTAAGEAILDPSAYVLLARLQALESTPAEIKTIAGNLLTRVNPDYTLPSQTDLIAQARILIEWAGKQIKGEHFD
ncbi:MAG: hypothetical protein C0396_09475 [Anaerolinea sp.]|nr:hypothetical protein [Anaerolinea sp.]